VGSCWRGHRARLSGQPRAHVKTSSASRSREGRADAQIEAAAAIALFGAMKDIVDAYRYVVSNNRVTDAPIVCAPREAADSLADLVYS